MRRGGAGRAVASGSSAISRGDFSAPPAAFSADAPGAKLPQVSERHVIVYSFSRLSCPRARPSSPPTSVWGVTRGGGAKTKNIRGGGRLPTVCGLEGRTFESCWARHPVPRTVPAPCPPLCWPYSGVCTLRWSSHRRCTAAACSSRVRGGCLGCGLSVSARRVWVRRREAPPRRRRLPRASAIR